MRRLQHIHFSHCDFDYRSIVGVCHDVLGVFHDLDEAKEYAELFKDREFVTYDVYGYPLSYNLIVEAIDIAKRFSINWRS